MNVQFRTLTMIAVITLLVGSGWVVAHASEAGANDAPAALATARISLVEAISIAEQHVRGRAVQAELESEAGVPKFEAEVVGPGNAVYDVTVDAISGKVLDSKPDETDSEQDEDEKDANQ